MEWNKSIIGREGAFKFNDIYIRIRFNSFHEYINGEQWAKYTFLDHTEYSPKIYGAHLGNANCCFSRTIKGWFSSEIVNTFIYINDDIHVIYSK